jgi:hypothetical protein
VRLSDARFGRDFGRTQLLQSFSGLPCAIAKVLHRGQPAASWETDMMRSMMTCAAVFALAACQPEAKTEAAPPIAEEIAPQAPVDGEDSKPSATTEAAKGAFVVETPVPGAKLTSPLVITGVADNGMYFEGVFPVELVVDGKVIARGPAQQAGDRNWTDPGPVNFRAALEFEVLKETNAELVLMEDMPELVSDDSDERKPAQAMKIPVVLVPAS